MTNKHLNLHIVVSGVSALTTLYLSIFLRDRYRVMSLYPGQRDKLGALHIGIAALQALGCLFANRTKVHATQVDEYIRARLQEEKQSRSRALALRSLPPIFGMGLNNAGDEEAPSEVDQDDVRWAMNADEMDLVYAGMTNDPGGEYFDTDLRRIDSRLKTYTLRNESLSRKNDFLRQLLEQNQKRNADQNDEIQRLSTAASKANESCMMALSKLNIFERELAHGRTTNTAATDQSQLQSLERRLYALETRVGGRDS